MALYLSSKLFVKKTIVIINRAFVTNYYDHNKHLVNIWCLGWISKSNWHTSFPSRKKENKQIKEKITSSFSGVQKANPVYASFAFRAKDSIFEEEPKHLGDIPEIEDFGGMIENVCL
jgi:hypothetical protein